MTPAQAQELKAGAQVVIHRGEQGQDIGAVIRNAAGRVEIEWRDGEMGWVQHIDMVGIDFWEPAT